MRVGGADASYIVTLPDSYDPNVAFPLTFGFHGRGRTNANFREVDASQIQTEFGARAIMVYPKSQGGSGWEGSGERELNIDFFEGLWDEMLGNYCVDLARVYAIGHSSGGHFVNILGCRYGDRLKGIGPVAGYLPERDCAGDAAAMVIHGGMDNQVNVQAGRDARDFWIARNGCDSTSSPGQVSPCVAYQGCDASIGVEWCEHSEPTYSNTNHGWPSFASKALWQFFSSLP